MQVKNILKVAIKSILKSRMRSLLTALGIIIGVAAVVVMVAIGDGAQMQVEQQIASLGSNLIVIFPGSSSSGGVRGGAGSFNRFTMDDVNKIRDETTSIKAVTPIVRSGGQVIGGAGNWSTSIQGVSPEYLEIREWPLSSGEFFTERDVISRAKVAVIGQTVAKQLFPNDDPIGQQIRVRNVPFKIIGVLSSKGQSAFGSDNDDVILAPSTTVLDRLSGGRYISFIQASANSLSQIDQAQEELRSIMRRAHHLNPGEDDDFTIRNQADITEAATETSKVLTVLLASVAGVSLIVGGIGIMNIMLVSVTERTREIGIRKAIGARKGSILIQFLIEAVILCIFGGILGIAFGIGIGNFAGSFLNAQLAIPYDWVMIGITMCIVVGLIFGTYPAYKAANLDPIEALRYE